MKKFRVTVQYLNEGKLDGDIIGTKVIERETLEQATSDAHIISDQITNEKPTVSGKPWSHFVTAID